MGFFSDLFGDGDSSSTVYQPSSYVTSVGSPSVTTSTTQYTTENAKQAENPDTSEYDAAQERKRRKNGVRGTFTQGLDTSGTVASGDAVGS